MTVIFWGLLFKKITPNHVVFKLKLTLNLGVIKELPTLFLEQIL